MNLTGKTLSHTQQKLRPAQPLSAYGKHTQGKITVRNAVNIPASGVRLTTEHSLKPERFVPGDEKQGVRHLRQDGRDETCSPAQASALAEAVPHACLFTESTVAAERLQSLADG